MTDYEGNIPKPEGSPDDLPDDVIYGRKVTDDNLQPIQDISKHEVDYPAGFARLYVRELLRRSQTNVTADPVLGEQYAAAAYDKARQDESGTDTTAAGEAAAKAGFRAAQAGKSDEYVRYWFMRSMGALPPTNPVARRELIATQLLYGRTLAFRAMRDNDDVYSELASIQFGAAEHFLLDQHKRGAPWDRYATMLSRHRATHDAVFGPRHESDRIALGGVWQAIRARRENSPEARPLRNALEHAKFVAKQALMNTVALGLAATQPRTDDSRWARKHRAIAAKMIS